MILKQGETETMASTSKCPFCGAVVRSDEKQCPQCGGNNPNYTVDQQRKIFHPKTIEELKQYCAERGMPLFRMRFFIGEDYREPRAFGIYKAGEKRYIVYKNKDTGERAIRYDGPDEAYAVNELFEKLLSECHNRGIYPDGPVQRFAASSRSASSGMSSNQGSDIIGIIFFAILAIFALVGNLSEKNQKQAEIKAKIEAKIEAFSENPDTYDPVEIGDKYYTYDLDSGEVIVDRSGYLGINNGYYREDRFLIPDAKQYYKAVDDPGEETVVQQKGVYYRDCRTWYVYIQDEQDWRPVREPAYRGTEIYLGKKWKSEWGVPDFSTSPVETGYYTSGNDYFYRDAANNNHTWYAYQEDIEDWGAISCPLKLGIPKNSLKYLTSGYDENEELGIRRFKKSTTYALEHGSEGYYLQGNAIYYYAYSHGRYVWYTYGRQPDSAAENEQESESSIWHKIQTNPDTGSIRYLGKEYMSEWQGEWSVTDFEKSAIRVELEDEDGYVKQGNNLYYHYKYKWYIYNSVKDTWDQSGSPADDDQADVYLGNVYRDLGEKEWEEDWKTTDFKQSSTWQEIRNAEIRAENAAREAERQKEEQRWENRWSSSDYDSWDSGDTDWSSDW